MKKNVFALVLTLVMVMSLTIGLAGCGNSATNGEVNVYNWGEYIENCWTNLLKRPASR